MTQINRPIDRRPATPVASNDSGPSWLEVAQSRKDRRGRKGLAVRLACYFTLIVCMAISATAYLIVQRNGTVTNNGIAAIGRATARSLALASRDAVANRDLDRLRSLVDEAKLSVNPNDPAHIERILLLDAQDAPLAIAGPALVDQFDDAINIDSPILSPAGTRVGTVRMTLTTAILDRSRLITYEAFAALGIGLVAAAILIVVVYVRQSFRPLAKLEAAMRRVIAGDVDAMIPVGGNNVRVFKLSEAFNELVAFARKDRDRTAQERAAMTAAIDELQRKVAINTAQLEAANGRLQSEIAEKEDFLRAVSHDLNAPLRNIGGMVAMLMLKDKDKLTPEVLNRLERIKKNVDVETDLINELLELSRIKTRRQTLDTVDTESIIWDLRGLFDNDLKTRHIDLIVETSLPTLYAERARVRQVFQNLIDNAIKYMDDAKPQRQIRVGCRVSETEAEFYVADTGLGIHPEDIEKVFCVFRRGRGELAQKIPGKGVGLASVKSIIETYAGRIWVTSTLREGTTFHFAINGKYVPSISTQLPVELQETTTAQAEDAAGETADETADDTGDGPPSAAMAA